MGGKGVLFRLAEWMGGCDSCVGHSYATLGLIPIRAVPWWKWFGFFSESVDKLMLKVGCLNVRSYGHNSCFSEKHLISFLNCKCLI